MRTPSSDKREIPELFLDRMSRLLGDQYAAFQASLYQHELTGLRVNTLKISPSEFTKLSPFRLTAVEWCPSGFTVDRGENQADSPSPGKHPFHTAGLYYLQEPSAMAAAQVLSPQPGMRVLDLAAAPGGKATHLAGLMQNSGLLVANEIHPKRVWDLAENLERCGVTNAIVTNESPARLADGFGEYFDRILVDAPCSGEGMFRKSETARQEWYPELVLSCSARQSSILEQAARLLKPGGRLAYTTCTFSAEENEGVIAKFLEDHREFDLVQIPPSPGFDPGMPGWIGLPSNHRLNLAVRIWPHRAQGEGHFIALLEKKSTVYMRRDGDISANHRERRNKKAGIRASARQLLDDFVSTNLSIQLDLSHVVLDGSYVYNLPAIFPELSGLNVIRKGLWLGSIKNYRFIPSHSLAMALNECSVKQAVRLQPSDRLLAQYLSGARLAIPGDDGWVLITVQGYPLGWGKRVKGIIKNAYPHGLRKFVI